MQEEIPLAINVLLHHWKDLLKNFMKNFTKERTLEKRSKDFVKERRHERSSKKKLQNMPYKSKKTYRKRILREGTDERMTLGKKDVT